MRDSHGVGMLKAIRKGWESFISSIHFFLGNKKMVEFQKDGQCGDSALEVSFLFLFSLASDKDSQVAKLWEQGGKWVGGAPASYGIFMIEKLKK